MHIIHKVIMGALAAAMVISGSWMTVESSRILKSQKRYEQLARAAVTAEPAQPVEPERQAGDAENVGEPEGTEDPEDGRQEDRRIDFQMLKTQNSDTVAWLYIPETNIDYPIVQAVDNETYLHRNFFGEEGREGAIFLDFDTPETLEGRNNVIYGHHMRDGSMFRDIERFKDPEYFKSHQYFQIYTPGRTIHLKAVSCYFRKSAPDIRRFRFKDEDSYQEFVKQMLAPCTFAEIPEEPVERLYTLVTCSYEAEDMRTVLFAVEIP